VVLIPVVIVMLVMIMVAIMIAVEKTSTGKPAKDGEQNRNTQ
jgi:hypothetical protein